LLNQLFAVRTVLCAFIDQKLIETVVGNRDIQRPSDIW